LKNENPITPITAKPVDILPPAYRARTYEATRIPQAQRKVTNLKRFRDTEKRDLVNTSNDQRRAESIRVRGGKTRVVEQSRFRNVEVIEAVMGWGSWFRSIAR